MKKHQFIEKTRQNSEKTCYLVRTFRQRKWYRRVTRVFLKFRLALTTAVHALNHRYSGS